MIKEVCGKLIHERVSGVLFTTQDFSLEDSLALYDLLVKEGFILESTKDQVYLAAYRSFINEIDDYFEYRNESLSDREKVHQLLENLTDKLKEINYD